MSKPQIQAIMTANTTGIRKGAKEVETTVNALGKKIRSAMGDSLRHSMTAMGAAVTAGVGATLTKTIRSGFEQSFAMEGSQVAMEALLGSLDKAREAMGMIAQEARENPMFSKQALAESAQALAGFADKSVPKLQGLLELSEKLSVLKPEAGIANAAQALRDALGGETERLKEYGFSSRALSEMKTQAGPGADLTPYVAKIVAAMGVSNSTLAKLNMTQRAQIAAVDNQLSEIGQNFVDSFWPQLQPQLKEMQTWMTKNSTNIVEAMNTVGTGIIGAVKMGGAFSQGLAKFSEMAGFASVGNDANGKEFTYGTAGTAAFLKVNEWKNDIARSVIDGVKGAASNQPAQLGPRAKELAPQVNIRMSAPTGGMMPGMQHT